MLLPIFYSLIISASTIQTPDNCVLTSDGAICSFVQEDPTSITPQTQPAPSTVQTTDGADLQPDTK
jgi:hypothetical protein